MQYLLLIYNNEQNELDMNEEDSKAMFRGVRKIHPGHRRIGAFPSWSTPATDIHRYLCAGTRRRIHDHRRSVRGNQRAARRLLSRRMRGINPKHR